MYINSTNNSEEQSWRAHTDFMSYYKTTVIKSERIKKKKTLQNKTPKPELINWTSKLETSVFQKSLKIIEKIYFMYLIKDLLKYIKHFQNSRVKKQLNQWLIHVDVWQKPPQYCKVVSLQLK